MPRNGKDTSGSSMQNFKSAVKKAFTKMSGKDARGEPKSASASRKSSDKKTAAKSRRSRK
jgi:hypothetical protein